MADQIKLQIILDDGSVKQGFLNIEKQADKTGKKIGDSLGQGSSGFGGITEGVKGISSILTSGAARFGVYGAALAFATKQVTDFAIAGEKAIATNIQFAKVAESAGLAADNLSEAIIRNTQGLIDDEDALQIATKAITALGVEAAKLPEILNISRSVARTLGTDFKGTFENLSQFLETGNARILRQYGIVLDLDAAYSRAAKSVGLTTAELTEQQKQVIRTNLVLEELPKKFQAGAQSVTPLQDAITRFTVSAKNQFESLQKSVASFLTETLIDNADKSNVATGRLSNNFSDATKEVAALESRLKILNEERLGAKGASALAAYALNIDETKKKLKQAREEVSLLQVELSGRSDQELFRQLDAAPSAAAPAPKLQLTPEQIAEQVKKRQKLESELTSFLSQQDQQRLNSQIQTNLISISTTLSNAEKLKLTTENLDIQDKIREEQKQRQISETKEKYRQQNLSGSIYETQALKAIDDNFNAQKIQAETLRIQQLKALRDQDNFDQMTGYQAVQSSFSLMADGMKSAALETNATLVASFRNLGKEIFNSVGSRVGAAFQAFGQALAKGEDAGQAFTNVMAQQVAQIASQIGNFFIQAGIARIAASYGADGTGYVMIAAGAALNVIGGLIGASAGGGSGSNASDSGSGGGIAATPTDTTTLPSEQEITRQEPNTQVQVVVQGDVLDSDESGSRIVSLINQAFDKKGVVINQGVVA